MTSHISNPTPPLNLLPTYQVGRYMESLATAHLVKQGVSILHQNFYCRLGEIDLIVRDKEYLVFVEVRYRTQSSFCDAKSTVTYAKQQKIRRVAAFFLQKHRQYRHCFCRFDVVGIDSDQSNKGQELSIEWIKGAFE